MRGAAAEIEKAVLAWDGVTAQPHRFGGIEFRLGKIELGHLHGDRMADLPLPKALRNELVDAGRARAHHALPGSGWITRPIDDHDDVDDVIALFRLNYDRITSRRRSND